MRTRTEKALLVALPAIVGGLYSVTAAASGFQLLEQNASGLGTAYAGTAVVAQDASTVFFNPAGMAYLPRDKKSVSFGVDAIDASMKFSDGGSTRAWMQPLGNGNGGNAGDLSYVPDAYIVVPVNQKVSFGLGISAPFGLTTEYNSGWNGRFQAIKSSVETVNFNPSLSYKPNDRVALGFGLDYQHLKGQFTSAVNYAAVIANLAALPGLGALANYVPTAGAGTSTINGSDSAWGYNLGAIFQVSPATRLGVSYRSVIKYHLTGTASFSPNANLTAALAALPPATAAALSAGLPTRGGDIYSDVKMPDILTFSGLHRINDKWNVMADLSWTGWAKIPALDFQYANDNSTFSSATENWRNTWRIAVGSSYRYNDRWTSRVGLAYDQSPVPDSTRNPRLPDSNRIWLTLGGQYRPSADSAIDFGYAHLFMKNAPIDNNAGSPPPYVYGVLSGSYKSSVDTLGVQYSFSF